MSKDRLNDYQLFYQEIPNSQDYLQESEIQDLVDEESQTSGLNASQVSLLAQDSLSATEPKQSKLDSSAEPTQSDQN